MAFAREIAHNVYFTDQGVIVEHGAPEQIFGNPQKRTYARVSGAGVVGWQRANLRVRYPGAAGACAGWVDGKLGFTKYMEPADASPP